MTVADLLQLSPSRLDALFRTLPCGPIPDGAWNGRVLTDSASAANLVSRAWKGKVFDAKKGTLVNRLAWGINGIAATVAEGPSLLDQQPCIVIDYARSLLIVKRVRDELRQVSDTLYLGKVYSGGKPLAHFALEMQK